MDSKKKYSLFFNFWKQIRLEFFLYFNNRFFFDFQKLKKTFLIFLISRNKLDFKKWYLIFFDFWKKLNFSKNFYSNSKKIGFLKKK